MPTSFTGENIHKAIVEGCDISFRNNISTCTDCDEILNGSTSDFGVVAIGWKNGWVIALYFVELVALSAVLLSLLYFLKSRKSPVTKSCYSCPDSAVLTVLCSFCLLPLMHISEPSPKRCLIWWLSVNVIFTTYSALLLTKTVLIQNLLKCEVANGHPQRRMAFSVFLVIPQLIISAALSIFGLPTALRFFCSSGRVVILCKIPLNINILSSVAYNWFLLFVLSTLAVIEVGRHRGHFCRTRNLAVVAFVGISSYTYVISCVYVKLQLKNYTLFTSVLCAVYLFNPVICLGVLYVPTAYFIFRTLRHQRKFQKRSRTMSPRREPSIVEDIFSHSFGFGPERTPSLSNFSVASRFSHQSSLSCRARESVDGVSDRDSVRVSRVRSCESLYDNVPRPCTLEETNERPLEEFSISKRESRDILDVELTREEFKVCLSSLKRLKASAV